MKNILFSSIALLLVAMCNPVAAQMPGKAVPEYKTQAGTLLHPGDTLRMGLGSNPNGSFIYAYIPASMFATRTFFNSSWANGRAVIKELRYQELKKGGDSRTIAIIKTNTIQGVVELEQAEQVREIITLNNNLSKPQTTTNGVADELLKLKALLDGGAITKEEFDQQKSKILNSK